jgi:hypothetical protein
VAPNDLIHITVGAEYIYSDAVQYMYNESTPYTPPNDMLQVGSRLAGYYWPVWLHLYSKRTELHSRARLCRLHTMAHRCKYPVGFK